MFIFYVTKHICMCLRKYKYLNIVLYYNLDKALYSLARTQFWTERPLSHYGNSYYSMQWSGQLWDQYQPNTMRNMGNSNSCLKNKKMLGIRRADHASRLNCLDDRSSLCADKWIREVQAFVWLPLARTGLLCTIELKLNMWLTAPKGTTPVN